MRKERVESRVKRAETGKRTRSCGGWRAGTDRAYVIGRPFRSSGKASRQQTKKIWVVWIILVDKKKISLQSRICRRVDEISVRHKKDVERSSRAYSAFVASVVVSY